MLESLSAKYSYLEAEDLALIETRQRARIAQWPELERALYQWTIRYESLVPISGKLLKAQATKLWQKLPQYQEMEVPIFSNGWLRNFKARHQIKARYTHGEAASIQEDAFTEQIAAIKAWTSKFPLSDIYNCDETGLFFKQLPNRRLST